ncbi:MAG TPA: ribosome small subunit-dependent GTPase A [Actinomycetota bacterium]|nr:ribosome small subunit-dependent GTPase A [Actinomycetota bacterium]
MPSSDIRGLAGWDAQRELEFEPHQEKGARPARVLTRSRDTVMLLTETDTRSAVIPGRMMHQSPSAELPVVGDWVAFEDRGPQESSVVISVLERRSKFSRAAAGNRTEEQVLATNVDTVFLVSSLDTNLNPRRIERYLATAYESGAAPVLVLTKLDLLEESLTEVFARVGPAAEGVPLHLVSSHTGEGLDALGAYLNDGTTVAVLGSSGVGKSTLINRIIGSEVMATKEIRDDGKGRHTTTHRELFPLPSGAALIDTPGMRELGLWEAPTGLDDGFTDIASVAEGCRFRDCSHDSEPACAVRAAIESGELDPARLESYRKLERELKHLELKQDRRAASEETRKWKVLEKEMRRSHGW